jgi:hypothetical protein
MHIIYVVHLFSKLYTIQNARYIHQNSRYIQQNARYVHQNIVAVAKEGTGVIFRTD